MPQQHLRVLLSFSRQTDNQIVATAGAVIAGMTGNKTYPKPSVDLAIVQAALTEFIAAIAGQAQGGITATAEKDKKRLVLVKLLRKLAAYVQAECDDDLPALLSSGFQAAGGYRGTSPLPKPVIASVVNGHTTELVLKVKKVRNARSYEVELCAMGIDGTPGPWQKAGSFTNSRVMTVKGLNRGTGYAFQVRAVGGSKGYSDWSDPVSHMCM